MEKTFCIYIEIISDKEKKKLINRKSSRFFKNLLEYEYGAGKEWYNRMDLADVSGINNII